MDGLFKYIWWRKFGKSPRFARETKAGFNEGFFDLPDETYLHGYWQSPDYFGPDTDALRRDLTLTTALDAPNAAMAAQIDAAPCPVSFHVRRGDYIAAGAYAACTPDYYRAAADHLATTLGKPLTCFIFSNDPAWARDNLDLGQDQVIVDLNDEATGHFDMALMARCAHHVIANSTFSWWGAWLNPDPDKQVVAPRNWFATQALHNPDLIPEQWHRL
ncbi:alpha-1,2-fucosyltransferase [Roseovarius sp.]|uniref:alpha-1,2-fucosyltransferase n=1 Tax=Roseovarius sp. TaxID=1486281 RepID=UPI00257F6590|nr:alpha-1,2-fucosyltransferase [Roseovarius sp.]